MLEIKKGTKFGKLTVVKEGDRLRLPSGQTNRTITCRCECGTVKDIRLLHLKRGRISSCGCKVKKLNGESHTIYGKLWKSINTRIRKNHNERHLYYDKGIKMCDEWKNDFSKFKKFCIDNNYKKGLYIDRINGDKGYEPSNCRFVTPKESSNNTSSNLKYTYNGKRYTITDLMSLFNTNVKRPTIYARLKRGWSVYKAFNEKT
tara:strand:- start:6412 stop:7020 length:609 start_codon:yes stop_codon:yes gene_type:complete